MTSVVLVGAARSGTKILRDTLATAPGVAAVPYDINYIWRLGNEDAPDDALGVDRLRTAKVHKIRDYLKRRQGGAAHLVEKTVATPLRLPFVDAVLPEAKYVFLVRNPIDVVESAMRQWLATPNWRYSVKKAISYPWLAAPGYAARQVAFAGRRVLGTSQAVPPWGPVYPGMNDDLAAGMPIVEVCAKQWNACNALALEGFEQIGKTPVVVRYEDFAHNPDQVVNALSGQLGVLPAPQQALAVVSPETIGGGSLHLATEDLATITHITDGTWAELSEFAGNHSGRDS